jgi:hypothetical protein
MGRAPTFNPDHQKGGYLFQSVYSWLVGKIRKIQHVLLDIEKVVVPFAVRLRLTAGIGATCRQALSHRAV